MKVHFTKHWSNYVTLFPTITVGRGWADIDWLWWTIEIS